MTIVDANNEFYEFTDSELLDRVNNDDYYYSVWKPKSFTEFLINLIKALISDSELVLLDSDFSDEELLKLGFEKNGEVKNPYTVSEPVQNKHQLIREIQDSNSVLSLFTSGTTGLPKKVNHSVESLTRMTRISKKYADNIWALVYNPTHMAGLQVIFQALLNGNKIVNLFNTEVDRVSKALDKYAITNISGTPTFYRMLLANNIKYPNVQRVTLGGEKSDSALHSHLRNAFPKAKINNIYASTELGSLFVSDGDQFKVPPALSDKVKIEEGELLVHSSLMPSKSKDDWFKTGDLVDLISKDPFEFRFKSRLSDSINVGGYKVSLLEVEDELRKLETVQEARVYSKPNSVLGNMIYAEVVTKEGNIPDKKEIFESLKSRLQDFKIPRIIKFVESLETTRTGKLSRR